MFGEEYHVIFHMYLTLWVIWNHRNVVIFRQKSHKPKEVIQMVNHFNQFSNKIKVKQRCSKRSNELFIPQRCISLKQGVKIFIWENKGKTKTSIKCPI